jgi:hypothetical protein
MKNNRSVQCTGPIVETLIIMKTMTEIVLQVHTIYVQDQGTFFVSSRWFRFWHETPEASSIPTVQKYGHCFTKRLNNVTI